MFLRFAALLMSLGMVASSSVAGLTATCLQTPSQPVVDSVGPGRGQRPAWMVDVARGWTAATEPVKTLWIVALPASRVRITSRRIDGPGIATVQREGRPATDIVEIDSPQSGSVTPGGATPDVMASYAFFSSQVFYPTSGCCRFDVEVDGTVVQIVRELRDASTGRR